MPGRFTPGEKASVTIGWEAGWAPEPDWTMWRSENSFPQWNTNSDPLVVQPAASRYTNCAISARQCKPDKSMERTHSNYAPSLHRSVVVQHRMRWKDDYEWWMRRKKHVYWRGDLYGDESPRFVIRRYPVWIPNSSVSLGTEWFAPRSSLIPTPIYTI
jgi:hypothetical protein